MNDPKILEALKTVLDPEIGINIVDFGLVVRAVRTPDGIDVSMGVTSTCPAMGLLVEAARAALRRSFPEVANIRVAIDVELKWCPERMTDEGRLALGWTATPAKVERRAEKPIRVGAAESTAKLRIPKGVMPKVSTRYKH